MSALLSKTMEAMCKKAFYTLKEHQTHVGDCLIKTSDSQCANLPVRKPDAFNYKLDRKVCCSILNLPLPVWGLSLLLHLVAAGVWGDLPRMSIFEILIKAEITLVCLSALRAGEQMTLCLARFRLDTSIFTSG